MSNLELIGVGRKAEILLGEFGSYLELAKAKKLKDLINAHKAGQTDAVSLASKLSAYCSICDLEADLTRDIKTANLKSKELHDSRS